MTGRLAAVKYVTACGGQGARAGSEARMVMTIASEARQTRAPYSGVLHRPLHHPGQSPHSRHLYPWCSTIVLAATSKFPFIWSVSGPQIIAPTSVTATLRNWGPSRGRPPLMLGKKNMYRKSSNCRLSVSYTQLHDGKRRSGQVGQRYSGAEGRRQTCGPSAIAC